MKETIDMKELARTERRNLARKKDQLVSEINDIDDRIRLTECIDELLKENEDQKADIESLQQLLAEAEMKLAEMRKLLDSVTKKSSEEGVQKALQAFVSYSKRKTPNKRSYIKNTILEFANVNRIPLPEELANAIDNLDDEQSEPKVVNVHGNYNDIHDNGTVNQK
jgi:hypothetical protein